MAIEEPDKQLARQELLFLAAAPVYGSILLRALKTWQINKAKPFIRLILTLARRPGSTRSVKRPSSPEAARAQANRPPAQVGPRSQTSTIHGTDRVKAGELDLALLRREPSRERLGG